jgi:hypothetical protein
VWKYIGGACVVYLHAELYDLFFTLKRFKHFFFLNTVKFAEIILKEVKTKY